MLQDNKIDPLHVGTDRSRKSICEHPGAEARALRPSADAMNGRTQANRPGSASLRLRGRSVLRHHRVLRRGVGRRLSDLLQEVGRIDRQPRPSVEDSLARREVPYRASGTPFFQVRTNDEALDTQCQSQTKQLIDAES